MFLELLVLALIVAVIVLWLQVSDQAQRLRALEEQMQAMQVRDAAGRMSAPVQPRPIPTPQPTFEPVQTPAPEAVAALSPSLTPERPSVGSGINFLHPYWSGKARRGPVALAFPIPAAPQPAWGGQPFAVLGGLLTLAGLGAVLSQLVRAGFFTPELQLVAAFGLAALLYGLAERARPTVGAVLRGLGYGIAALAFGAMFQAGALPVLTVMGLTGLLSLLVGWHAWRRREPLTLLVALSGATLSTWLLADDLAEQLGTLGTAQSALTVVFVAALWSIWRGRSLGLAAVARWPLDILPLLLPLGTLGLWVSAVTHGLSGESLLWLLMGGVGVLGLTFTAQAPATELGKASVKTDAVHAAAIVGVVLTAAAALLLPVGGRPLLPSALGLLLVTLGALAWRVRQFPQIWANKQPDAIRDALVLAVLGTAASLTERWVATRLGTVAGDISFNLRLLPYALLAAVYGRWSGSRIWQRSGAGLGALLLMGANVDLESQDLTTAGKVAAGLGTLAALGAALRLTSAGSSALLLAAAAFIPLKLFQGDPAPLLPLLGAPALAFWAGARWEGRLLWFAVWTLGLGLTVATLNGVGASAFSSSTELGTAAWNWLYLSVSAGGLLALSLAPSLRLAWESLKTGLRLNLDRAATWLEVWAVGGWLLGTALLLNVWLGREETALLLTGALAALLVPVLARLPLRSKPLLPQLLLSAGILLALLAAPLLAETEPERLSLGSGWLAWVAAAAAVAWAVRPQKANSTPLLTLPGWGLLLLGSALAQGFGGLLALTLGLPLDEWQAGLISTGLLLLSGLTGLLWAYRSEQRPQWWLGLTLFGLGAIKLVMVDLEGLGVSARGLGLTLVGLLLLGIGQLAPAEEAEPKHGAAKAPKS